VAAANNASSATVSIVQPHAKTLMATSRSNSGCVPRRRRLARVLIVVLVVLLCLFAVFFVLAQFAFRDVSEPRGNRPGADGTQQPARH
jgi:hypothetical protein